MKEKLIKEIARLYNESIPDFAPKTSRIAYWSEFFNSENERILSYYREHGQIPSGDEGRLSLDVLELVHILTMHKIFSDHPEIQKAMAEECRELSEILSFRLSHPLLPEVFISPFSSM